jgi:hypothetical protein
MSVEKLVLLGGEVCSSWWRSEVSFEFVVITFFLLCESTNLTWRNDSRDNQARKPTQVLIGRIAGKLFPIYSFVGV